MGDIAANYASCSKNRFQIVLFQSNRKNALNFPAPPTEHIVLNVEDIPNCFPKKSNKAIINVIIGPATYQGQGAVIQFI